MHDPTAGHVRLGDSRSIGSASCCMHWIVIATDTPASTAVGNCIVSILTFVTTAAIAVAVAA